MLTRLMITMSKTLKPSVLIFLMLLSCNLENNNLNINLGCLLEHSTTVVKLESGLLGETEMVHVILAWTWLLGKLAGDGIIVERSIADSVSEHSLKAHDSKI